MAVVVGDINLQHNLIFISINFNLDAAQMSANDKECNHFLNAKWYRVKINISKFLPIID